MERNKNCWINSAEQKNEKNNFKNLSNNHANTPRSEPGEGYKTPGPSAGDTAVHKCK